MGQPGFQARQAPARPSVALHRAAHLVNSNPGARVLLTTFSDALANLLRSKLHLLLHREPDDRIVIDSLDAVGLSLFEELFEPAALAPRETVETLLESSASLSDTSFSITFLLTEWERVVDAWQLSSWEEYRNVSRIGRFRRLSETSTKGVVACVPAGQAGSARPRTDN